jgi:hypothetical protein
MTSMNATILIANRTRYVEINGLALIKTRYSKIFMPKAMGTKRYNKLLMVLK